MVDLPATAAVPPAELALAARGIIVEVRKQAVILDADVAAFFGRKTGEINQQRKRSADRFPASYAFELTAAEWADLKSQNVISSSHGGRRRRPWAYTEQGFAMLSTGLRGERAAALAMVIIETFVSWRRGTLPSGRVMAGPGAGARRKKMLAAIYRQMQRVLDADLPTGRSGGEELKAITQSAFNSVKALISGPAQQHEHLAAQIRKLEAETAKLWAETRRAEAETTRIDAEALAKQLENLKTLREMASQLERDDVAEWMDAFDQGRLPPPA